MTIDKVINATALSVLFSILFGFVLAAPRRTSKRTSPVSILSYGRIGKILGFGSLFTSGILMFVIWHDRTCGMEGCIVAGGIALLMLCIPLEFFYRRIEFNDRDIVIYCFWRKARRIPWSDVVSFAYLEKRSDWVLKTKSFGTMKFSTFLEGLIEFYEMAIRQGKATP